MLQLLTFGFHGIPEVEHAQLSLRRVVPDRIPLPIAQAGELGCQEVNLATIIHAVRHIVRHGLGSVDWLGNLHVRRSQLQNSVV